MLVSRHFRHVAAAFVLSASVGVCSGQSPSQAEMQGIILDLQRQNQALQRALVEANRNEKEATTQLALVRQRLEALGKNLLDGGNDRLVEAAADYELAKERIAALESAATRLSSTITEYLGQAIASDPEARLRVETSLRELDAALGLRQKRPPAVRYGTLRRAHVVSLDQESGMLVLDLGESQGAKIGMTFELLRGQQPYGKAILFDVRKGLSGAFAKLDNPSESPRPGDLAILATEP
jgi:DNA-binding FrmR family transcriptional regulator